jgi:metal-responsive CopG/Arc/MetJ family transcriptional regulator
MAKAATKKIGLEIDAGLYARLSRTAKANGQSRRHLLEQAVRLYLETAALQGTIRPEVMAAYRESTRKNSELLRRLAH